MYFAPANVFSLGPLRLEWDQPWWWYAGLLAILAMSVVFGLLIFRRAAKKGNLRVGTWHPWTKASARIATILFCAIVGLVVFNIVSDAIQGDGSGEGELNVVAVIPRDTFIGSDIAFCVPDVGVDGPSLHIPKNPITGWLTNPASVKFAALGLLPYGIDDYSAYLKKYLEVQKTDGTVEYPPRSKTFRIVAHLPYPEVLKRYGDLKIETDVNKLPPAEAARAYGSARKECGGSSHFHSGSGGGLTARLAAPFEGPYTDAFNSAMKKGVEEAYELIDDPDAIVFGGTSAREQALRNFRVAACKNIIAAQSPITPELEADGWIIQCRIEFHDKSELPLDEEIPQDLKK